MCDYKLRLHVQGRKCPLGSRRWGWGGNPRDSLLLACPSVEQARIRQFEKSGVPTSCAKKHHQHTATAAFDDETAVQTLAGPHQVSALMRVRKLKPMTRSPTRNMNGRSGIRLHA